MSQKVSRARAVRRSRPTVEALEDRCVPSGITKVRDLGTVAAPAGTTTVNLSLSAAVADGDSIVVEVATHQAVTTGAVAVTDAGGNAYAKDADAVNPSGPLRVLVFAAHHVHALGAGSPLTITLANSGIVVASAAEFAGLGAAVPVDAILAGTGLSASPSSGLAATHADGLLLGAIGAVGFSTIIPAPIPVAFTPGAGYTALASATQSTDFTPYTRLDLVPEYRIVSAAGSYAADGTLGDNRVWAAALVAYRAAPPAPSDLSAGLSDVTAAVVVTPGKPVRLANGRTRLRLTLRNGGGALAVPLSLVLTNLPRRARLRKATGVTAVVAPAGLPFLNVPPSADGLFSPGETMAVVLEFAGKVPKRYRPAFRVVAGIGPR